MNSINETPQNATNDETREALTPLALTVITAIQPNVVTKRFSLDKDGKLQKQTVASIISGNMRRLEFLCAREFMDALEGLRPDQCFVYGVPPVPAAALITEKEWHQRGRPTNAFPRTNKTFHWPAGPGVMLLDYDAPKDGARALRKVEIEDALRRICPAMLERDLIWWPSTSSMIYDTDGNQLIGLKGQRFYPLVQDASDIPRAGSVLNNRCWLAGFGRFEISKSGALLERSLFDNSVWQPSRIDFAAGANCGAGLTQQRCEPELLGSGGYLDTKDALPDLTKEEQKQVEAMKASARAAVALEAVIVKNRWADNQASEIVRHNPRITLETAKEIAQRAADKRDLMGDYPLILIEDGEEVQTTVGVVLDNPDRYHNATTLDPLEPDYDGRRPVGKLFLYQASPCLFSMAHGGVRYALHRQPQMIELARGKTTAAVDTVANLLRNTPEYFDFGTELVRCRGGKMQRLCPDLLAYCLGSLTQFWQKKKTGEIWLDPPPNVCRQLLAMGEARHLRKLDAIITAPTVRPDGSLLKKPGYDAVTRLLFESDGEPIQISDNPTKSDALQALQFLWEPFKDFPFCTAIDRAVHLAALITAAVRPVLPTAPAFGYDAPVQGSGKTLLAKCIGALVTGEAVPIWAQCRDDNEMRKRIFALLFEGQLFMLLDNLTGFFDSEAFAAALTSPTYTDRILGATKCATAPNRAMFCLAGNNLNLAGDMPRRVLVSRIDPESDRPYARRFDLNPESYCLANRESMIAAALTVVRAMVIHGCKKSGPGSMASFELFDSLVRQSVIFANELWPDQFGDVMEAIDASQTTDQEQETLRDLLEAWHAIYGNQQVKAAAVLDRSMTPFASDVKTKALRESIEACYPTTHVRITSKSFGHVLKHRKGRIVGGKRLICSKGRDGVMWWKVEVKL